MTEQQMQDAPSEQDTKPVVEVDIDESDTPEGDLCGDLPLAARIEALLVSTDRPLQDKRIAELLELKPKTASKVIEEAVESLNAEYAKTGRAFRVERVAKGWQVLTHADFGPLLTRLHADRQQAKLSQAALETLAIIAYRQPIMRAEIEAIRGVAAGEVLRGLMERRLVRVAGRAEELGRPMLYGTTSEFLTVFGMAGVDDLPAVDGLQREPAYRPPKPEKQAPKEAEEDVESALSGSEDPAGASQEKPTSEDESQE